ncbi:hypothetical protein [Altericroceibacterium endophyticum]|uniref:hypothetical protein n=1 Tax=Altericroceibacterium endophyticum TaxID=1808508 RepID=UPI00192784E4|nr:hypothetical protein [Altericroceibacterium endophyticum]
MSSFNWVSIVALVGYLVLALAALRSQHISLGKAARLALIWFGIFLVVAIIFNNIG